MILYLYLIDKHLLNQVRLIYNLKINFLKSNFMKKNIKFLFFIGIFFLAIIIWYSPIVFKGYSIQGISKEIILARNYYQTGVLADQNNLNITLAPSLIKENGHPLVLSEYLGSFFYSKIFKLIGGIPSYNNLVLISLALYALILVVFTILVLYLFNFKTAIIFSLIYMIIPFVWGATYSLGPYEFCLLFWSLFFIFYFLGVKRNDKWSIPLFVISGFFLVLSGLSKEIAFVFALSFFIYLFFKKMKKELLSVFIPFVCLLAIFWLPSMINGENKYAVLLGANPEKSIFSDYTHVFPDPYTYYFEKEIFLEKLKSQDLEISGNLETQKVLVSYGFAKITIFGRAKIGTYILVQHLFRFFSLRDFGGPFIVLFLILGFIYLKKKSNFIYGLFKYWLIISILVFSYILLVSRIHLIDFIWPLVLLVSVGLIYLIDTVKDNLQLRGKRELVFTILIFGFIIYHFILVDHVVLGDIYNNDFIPRSMAYSELIKSMDIKDEDIIAVPGDFPTQIANLSYFTNKSFVLFASSTIDKLSREGNLKKAFEAFNVKYILGYSDAISEKAIEQAKIINIASESLKFDIKKVSENKSFFMNLIR